MVTSRHRFRISLTAERFLRYYQGHARAVLVRAEDGSRIQLPASRLRPFVASDGIHGRFELEIDEDNRFVGIRRLSV